MNKILATKEDINDCISQAIDHFKQQNPHFNSFKLCIPWSAGSGKTSAIIEFIAEYWRLGIIYSAGTIGELEIVYSKLIKKLPEKYHNKILRFHSQRPDWENFKENPDLLKDYPVLFLTHHTLSSMLPSYLVSRRQGYSETRPKDSVRRYCITDEKAIYSKEFIIPVNYMSYLKLLFQNTDIEDRDFIHNYSKLLPVGLETAENILQEFKGYNAKLPVQNNLIQENHLYGKTVRLVTELLYPKIEQVGSIGNLQKTIYAEDTSLIYDISNIEINHINFDGTGDIIFSDSSNWYVAENKFPYQFKGTFNLIENFDPIIRKTISNTVEDEYNAGYDFDCYVKSIVENTVKEIKSGNKPLIVTWKDVTHISINDNKVSDSNFNIKVKTLESIEKELLKYDFKKNTHYYLTYWYSGETRATNRFSDANQIWLYQPCYLPTDEVRKLKTVFQNDKLTTKDLFVSEIVQAIYRTQVRKKLSVDVYFDSSLYSIMNDVKNYLNVVDNIKLSHLPEDIFNSMKIRKNVREDILKLAEYFGGVDVLLNQTLDINLNVLAELLPRSVREISKYNTLVKSLKENLNCELVIKSNSNNVKGKN